MTELEKIFEKYGERVEIGEKVFRGIVTPVEYKSKMNTEGDFTPIGFQSDATYVLYAPSDADLLSVPHGTAVKTENGDYMIYHSDNFLFRKKVFYCYAYMKRMVADA